MCNDHLLLEEEEEEEELGNREAEEEEDEDEDDDDDAENREEEERGGGNRGGPCPLEWLARSAHTSSSSHLLEPYGGGRSRGGGDATLLKWKYI